MNQKGVRYRSRANIVIIVIISIITKTFQSNIVFVTEQLNKYYI